MISTDLELASAVSDIVGRTYREAVEFTTALPSYSLIRYRDVLEAICGLIAHAHDQAIESLSLFEQINELMDAGRITFGFKDRCHKLRLLCNSGAHRKSSLIESRKKDELHAEQQTLKRNSLEARQILLQILESYYRSAKNFEGEFDYLLVEIQTQEWKELLFSAVADDDANDKFKAGLWCEAEADRKEFEFNGIIAPSAFENNQNFLKRLAATFHLASYNSTKNIDAGFRYAQFVVQEKIDGDKQQEARRIIEEAAKTGHGEACDYHASILYDEKRDYENAERFWLLAAQRNITRAYSCLYIFYTEGRACAPDPEKAVAFVERGVEQECRDCLYSLGRAYFEGKFVQNDVDKARDLLKRAADLGHGIARGYLYMVVNGGVHVIAEEFARFGRMLEAIDGARQEAKLSAPDPYSLCSCGSGKKHKWCCMTKAAERASSRSPLAQFLPRF